MHMCSCRPTHLTAHWWCSPPHGFIKPIMLALFADGTFFHALTHNVFTPPLYGFTVLNHSRCRGKVLLIHSSRYMTHIPLARHGISPCDPIVNGSYSPTSPVWLKAVQKIDTLARIDLCPLHLHPTTKVVATQYTHYAWLQTHFGTPCLHTWKFLDITPRVLYPLQRTTPLYLHRIQWDYPVI